MKRMIAALVLVTSAVHADEGAIQGVITEQMDAFKVDDFGTAFTYAAPNIQQLFGTSDNFGQMVRQGFPMVWQPGAVEYLSTEDRGATWSQEVLITDGSGRLHKLLYLMIETPDGWKIAGVQILEAPEIGA